MKSTSLSLIGALALAGATYGAQPPDVVVSDSNDNTAMGTGALSLLTSGIQNTASGWGALNDNSTGSSNTAFGLGALGANTTGSNNTAFGTGALDSHISGDGNTASGSAALAYNTLGSNNTATGTNALGASIGSNNTAIGAYALFYPDTSGSDNVAVGYQALYSNTTGEYNTASGDGALHSNINGVSNTASGYQTLYANTTGIDNTATGVHALASNTSGSNNIAEGWHAGVNLTTGSNNIDIGSPGAAGDHNTIKIGVQGTQTATFIAGIYGHSLTGSAVVVTSAGELGVIASSERFKTAIRPMGSNTAKLGQLRPVTFKLKSDATGTRQYGLIAEEVAKVYPELVIRDQSGRIDGVRYDELAPMLLNEVQKQAAEIRELKQQQKQSVAQAEQLRDVQQQLAALHAALVKLQSKDELVAHR